MRTHDRRIWAHRRKPPLLFLVAAILAALLPALGYLQYRWLGKVSEREREQMQASLKRSLAAFRQDFDREIARVFASFQIAAETKDADVSQAFVDALNRWNATAPYPRIAEDLFWNHVNEKRQSTLMHWNAGQQAWEAADWNKELSQGSIDGIEEFRWPLPGTPVRIGLLSSERPAISIPANRSRFFRVLNVTSASGEEGLMAEKMDPTSWSDQAIVRLNVDAIRSELVPRLMGKHFGGPDTEYVVEIQESLQNTLTPFTDDKPAPDTPEADAEEALFELRMEDYPELSGATPAAPLTAPFAWVRGVAATPLRTETSTARVFTYRFERGGTPDVLTQAFTASLQRGLWRIRATHRAGSLDAAVEQGRRRNLFAAFGILALLGASMSIVVVSANRDQRLARQQIEFVSAVSHEMRTPLAVICAAGENLADGLIRDPERLRGYGKLIRDEGRRLTETVEQALGFASLQSGLKRYALAPAKVGTVVEGALEALNLAIREGNFTFETRIDDGLPALNADASAIGRAIQNLIGNAMKYGGPDRWIGVRASIAASMDKPHVRIDVEDHGRGISAHDRPNIFKPFYRGRSAIDAQTPGSGLGLSLVQDIVIAHDGTIDVESGPNGSTFSVFLPVTESRTA